MQGKKKNQTSIKFLHFEKVQKKSFENVRMSHFSFLMKD